MKISSGGLWFTWTLTIRLILFFILPSTLSFRKGLTVRLLVPYSRLHGVNALDFEKAVTSGPFIHPGPHNIGISASVRLSADLMESAGLDCYADAVSAWRKLIDDELMSSKYNIMRISQLSGSKISLQWNVSFVPYSMIGLVSFGNLLGWQVKFYNVLDKEREQSSFSWSKLRKVFTRAFGTGELILPHAVIVGSTVFSFVESENRTMLVLQEERLNLVRSLQSDILKNRKLALDLLEFLDGRKPSVVGINDWNDIIISKLDISRKVPGMRQFDIDGLDAERQTEILRVSNTVLGYATAVVLLFGISFATALSDQLFK